LDLVREQVTQQWNDAFRLVYDSDLRANLGNENPVK
jgi:hypothetical protein